MDGCPSIIIPSDLELHCYGISIYCCLLLHLLVCTFKIDARVLNIEIISTPVR